MTRPLSLLCFSLLLLSACYRQDVRWVDVRIPEAESATELKAIQGRLQQLNGMMPRDQPLYYEIEVKEDLPGLAIRYDARLQSIKNIEHEISRLGFQANNVPGNEARREQTRQQFGHVRPTGG